MSEDQSHCSGPAYSFFIFNASVPSPTLDRLGIACLCPSETPVTTQCPKCQSSQIGTRNRGKKIGGTIGTVAGAAGGATGMMSGAEIGATVGLVAGPVGVAIGGLAGAILGGIIGGTAGCAVGTKLGETVDDNILDNFECLACGHTFGTTRD